MVRILLAVFIGLTASAAGAEEIPLKSIWAWDMKGTRDITEIEPEIYTKLQGRPTDEQSAILSKSLIQQFSDTLDTIPKREEPAAGFVVPGVGNEALKSALEARLQGPSGKIPEGDVTLVFFVHNAAESVQIYKVERQGQKIEVHYRLKSRETMQSTNTFALIPLGKLPAGEYDVAIIPENDRPAVRNVCKPFSFTVERK